LVVDSAQFTFLVHAVGRARAPAQLGYALRIKRLHRQALP
jgi:hypothetical protein